MLYLIRKANKRFMAALLHIEYVAVSAGSLFLQSGPISLSSDFCSLCC